MRVFMKKLRVEIENGMRVYLGSPDFEIEMRVSQKSGNYLIFESNRGTRAYLMPFDESPVYSHIFDFQV